MESKVKAELENQNLVSRLFTRLRQDAPAYDWDDSFPPFHSSYDNWHIWGYKRQTQTTSSGSRTSVSDGDAGSRRSSTVTGDRAGSPEANGRLRVVARISVHLLRLEREYKLAEKLGKEAGPGQKYFIKTVDFLRLPARRHGDPPLVAMVSEAPGRNYLIDMVELGPNFYPATPLPPESGKSLLIQGLKRSDNKKIPLSLFLAFATGAVACCEQLHHGNELVHGELRGDAFHFDKEKGFVRLINFGSGARSFENGLTSAGWSSLTSQVGVEHRLQFIAPEQTGRLPAEPDCRTDIYSLGVLFWTMLVNEPPFPGKTPLDIMQNVLGRRIPAIDSRRPDVPHTLSRIIQKMTQKNMAERYQSSSGLKHDLLQCQKYLEEGNAKALDSLVLGSKDVSSSFNHPTWLIGRDPQLETIVNVIERAGERAATRQPVSKQGLHSLRTASTISGMDRSEVAVVDDIASEDASSSPRGRNSRLHSVSEVHSGSDSTGRRHQDHAWQDVLVSPGGDHAASADSKGSADLTTSADGRGSNHGIDAARNASFDAIVRVSSLDHATPRSASLSFVPSSASLLRSAQKLRKVGRCEVIGIRGAAGLGKSSLLQAVQARARDHGYYASSKFDQVKRVPFDPVLRIMSSLFRQIFSESDVSTEFHQNVRDLVRPVWGSLHKTLELPPWLLSQTPQRVEVEDYAGKDETSIASSSRTGDRSVSSTDWHHAGGVIRDGRMIATFLDVLRLLALQKFLCLCLDDLQFADDESLDLVQSVISAGIPIVLILTFRAEDDLPFKARAFLEGATQVELTPLNEDQVSEYVAATLHRNPQYILPLVAILHQQSGGSPFFIRELLDQCYRTKCVYYSWRSSQWEFDLDKLFHELSNPNGQQVSSGDYVLRRLKDLPNGAPTLLCWASLIGTSFSFTLLNRVITCDCSKASPAEVLPPRAEDAVAALQSAMSSYAIMPTDDEDRFRFSHDRYMTAAFNLCTAYSRQEMNYVLSCALMKHTPWDDTKPTQLLFNQSRHVCSAISVIRERAQTLWPFRQLLCQAAEIAAEQGARQMAISFLSSALELLADDTWDESNKQVDAGYEEILDLKVQTAGSYWYVGDFASASTIVADIMQHARTPTDRSRAYVIESRIYARQGDSRAAFSSMKKALGDLGHEIIPTTWEDCDRAFEKIVPQLKLATLDLSAERVAEVDPKLIATGSVMVELISAAYWSDFLQFYQLTLQMLQMSIDSGVFPQVALGYLYLAGIAVARFDMLEIGMQMGATAKRIMAAFDEEIYTSGRGLATHALFLGHLETTMSEQLPILQDALEATVTAGDRILHILNTGITAAYRLWSSHEMADVEAFVMEQDDHIPNWQTDVRAGGPILISVRQYARAMLGKTMFRSAMHVLDDDEHQSAAYYEFVNNTSSEPDRPLAIYGCYRITALYRFGHVKEAAELGEALMGPLEALLSMRYAYVAKFYYAMALIDKVRNEPQLADRDMYIARVRDIERKIKTVNSYNDINFASWLFLMNAELAEVDGHFDVAVARYESAVSHCVLNANTMEEAMSYELYAEFLIRRGSSRPAGGLIQDAIAAYQRAGAVGKAQHIMEKHAFILHGTKSLTTAEVGTQTAEAYSDNTQYKLQRNDEDLASLTSEDRTKAWLAPGAPGQHTTQDSISSQQPGLSAVGLDMIDLANILESSQLLSSELRVDKLLANLTKIIVDSTNADFGGVVVNDEEIGWTVAAVHGTEGPINENVGLPLDKIDDALARQITLYVLRFRESLFLQNVLDDERFVVSATYRKDHPEGRAMIGLPILHGDNVLLGAIYIEGPPRSLTERNTAVLRLLVNQISISIANALLFKKLEKASASNAAMLEIQNQALAQARESERKAKMAEANAMEQVRLKEEAAKAKSMFLANVSHELRTPLNGVIGMSELLKESKLNTEQEGFADSIRVCADTLLSVINDILDYSKLEAGKMQMFNVQLSLNETISEVVRALSYTNLERGLQTIEELHVDPKMLVMGDPVRLHQVLMNLLSNAYKFTARGKVTVRAEIEREDETSVQICCSVTDTGIGVSEEQRKKLFLPFSQADGSTARTYGGTGLGLSICKAIVEIMKGRIWLTSETGVGTTVSFSLPFQKVGKGVARQPNGERGADPMSMFGPSVQETDGSAEAHTSLSGIPRSAIRICIAEDNPINQKIAISFVKKLGFKCEAFGDGQQAVDALTAASAAGNPFHLVLMDVQMPVLDGYNATREIRKHADPVVRHTLVIAMTASAIRGDKEKCLEAGMNNYLAKPVRANVLKQMLEGYLNQSTKSMPDLQQQTNAIAKQVVDEAKTEQRENGSIVERPSEDPAPVA